MERRNIWDIDVDDEDDGSSQIWANVTIRQGSLIFPVNSTKRFEQLRLPRALLQGVYQAGLKSPRDIQQFVFPMLFFDTQANLVIQAPARTGKTTAALIKAVDVATSTRDPQGKVLMVHPTRDSASRAIATAKDLARFFSQASFHLAVRDNESKAKHHRKVTDRFLVGTPEKLREYVEKKYIDTDDIRLVVLDDIDSKTSGNGHQSIVSRMMKNIPAQAQRVLLTGASSIDDKFVASVMSFPVFVEFPPEAHHRCVGVKQYFLLSSSFKDRMHTLVNILKIRNNRQMVIVCDSMDSVVDVFEELEKKGISDLVCLHRKVKIVNKQTIVEGFKWGKNKVLVTTPLYVDSIVFHSGEDNATVVNFDTQVSCDDNLNHDVYHKRARILLGIPGGLSVNMVNERWADYTRDYHGEKLELKKPSSLSKYLIGNCSGPD